MPADEYLRRVLADGAQPFRYPGQVRTLLGLAGDDAVPVDFAPAMPRVGFRYLRHREGPTSQRQSESPSTATQHWPAPAMAPSPDRSAAMHAPVARLAATPTFPDSYGDPAGRPSHAAADSAAVFPRVTEPDSPRTAEKPDLAPPTTAPPADLSGVAPNNPAPRSTQRPGAGPVLDIAIPDATVNRENNRSTIRPDVRNQQRQPMAASSWTVDGTDVTAVEIGQLDVPHAVGRQPAPTGRPSANPTAGPMPGPLPGPPTVEVHAARHSPVASVESGTDESKPGHLIIDGRPMTLDPPPATEPRIRPSQSLEVASGFTPPAAESERYQQQPPAATEQPGHAPATPAAPVPMPQEVRPAGVPAFWERRHLSRLQTRVLR